MNTIEFLSKILPETGLKVLAALVPMRDKDGNTIVGNDGKVRTTAQHKTFNSIADLVDNIKLRSTGTYNLFMALGGYDKEKSFVEKVRRDGTPYKGFSRSAEFTVAFKSFWLDLDCGEAKAESGLGYRTQEEALSAVDEFVETLELPKPMIINSGGGLHVYWALTEEIDADNWQRLAIKLEAIVKYYGLIVDSACTTDRARILRPIGTINFKYNKPVTCLRDAPCVNVSDFIKPLVAYYKDNKDEIKQFEQVKRKEYTEYVANQAKQYDADLLIVSCNVVNTVANATQLMEEPIWRGVTNLLWRCKDGMQHLERVRKLNAEKYPDATKFNEDRTYNQVERYIASSKNPDPTKRVGPHTCAMFRNLCPGLCDGCPHTKTSPLLLAEKYDEAEIPQFHIDLNGVQVVPTDNDKDALHKTASVSTSPVSDSETANVDKFEKKFARLEPDQPPYPYKRTNAGLVVRKGETDEAERVFFNGDMIPIMTKFVDIVDGEKQVSVKYLIRIGPAGCQYTEVTFPMKDWYAADRLKQRLGAIGISISEERMKLLIQYMRAYLDHVGDKMEEMRQVQHFGWVDDSHQFLLGNTLFRPDGVVNVTPHSSTKGYIRYFGQRGSLAEWQKLMQRLESMRATEQQICILASLGSTLMKFTNYNGIWLHLKTKPGYGKTTTQEMMNGIWGNPSDLLLNAKDTINAIEERFGRWCNIGVNIDELSNLDPHIASDLLLGVTQGRTKRRLDTNMRERADDLSWQMMVVSSGNFSILDRINSYKQDIAAEVSRTLEFSLPKPKLTVSDGERLIKTPIRENYGVAGYEWLSKLVRVPEHKIKMLIDKATESFSSALDAKSDERFWITGCAVMYVAGVLANKMGLLVWDMNRIFVRLAEIVQANRGNRNTYEFNSQEVLSAFLAGKIRETLIVDKGVMENSTIVKLLPSFGLSVRYEIHSRKLYILKTSLKDFCSKQGVGIGAVLEDLASRGLIARENARIVLTKDTNLSTVRSYCVEINVDDLMSNTIDNLVKKEKGDDNE